MINNLQVHIPIFLKAFDLKKEKKAEVWQKNNFYLLFKKCKRFIHTAFGQLQKLILLEFKRIKKIYSK